jgi:hypothetical protein
MGNDVFRLVVVAVLGLHAAALALALTRRGPAAGPVTVGAVAAAVLAWMAFHRNAFEAPVDGPVVGLATFEALALVAAVLALRGVRWAGPPTWLAFTLHAAASTLAVAYAFLFRMDRLF